MLELQHLKFKEVEDAVRPGCYNIICRHVMDAEITVCDFPRYYPRAVVHQHLREAIWHKAYGDLRNPLMRLLQIASCDVSLGNAAEFERLAVEIRGLLAFKNPKVEENAAAGIPQTAAAHPSNEEKESR